MISFERKRKLEKERAREREREREREGTKTRRMHRRINDQIERGLVFIIMYCLGIVYCSTHTISFQRVDIETSMQ